MLSKHYKTDDDGFPIIYGMTEEQYDKKVREFSIAHECSYRKAMDILHNDILNKESAEKINEARESESKEARFHREPVEIENLAWELAQDITKIKKFTFQKTWKAYSEWLKLLNTIDPRDHDIRKFAKDHAASIAVKIEGGE